eukprot:6333189-Prymnesium_polylepis.1
MLQEATGSFDLQGYGSNPAVRPACCARAAFFLFVSCLLLMFVVLCSGHAFVRAGEGPMVP